jgi:hypothetical protein
MKYERYDMLKVDKINWNNETYENAVKLQTIDELIKVVPVEEFKTFHITHNIYKEIDPVSFQPTVIFEVNDVWYSAPVELILDANKANIKS